MRKPDHPDPPAPRQSRPSGEMGQTTWVQLKADQVDAGKPFHGGQPLSKRYELKDLLGRGGMGVVVSARDRSLGRTVAVKVLHARVRDVPSVRRRFLLEAQIGAQLEHPNIPPVYSMESDVGSPAFTMRLLSSTSFKAYLKQCKAAYETGAPLDGLALSDRLERLLGVCAAVQYAHSRGVVHRDIKPENVVLGEHGEVYLVDWGIAKVLSAPESDVFDDDASGVSPKYKAFDTGDSVQVSGGGTTEFGEIVGTPAYMPPEQARGLVDQHGPATDQYALGMVLQQCLTLKRPRTGKVQVQLLAASVGKRETLDEMANGRPVPPEVAAIVAKATAPNVSDRYASVEDFANDVRRFVRGDAVSVHPEGFAKRTWRKLSRRPSVTLAVALSIFTLVSLVSMATVVDRLQMQERAATHALTLRRLTAEIVRRSEAIDARFATARRLVESIASTSRTLALYSDPATGPNPYGAGGRLAGQIGPPLRDMQRVSHYPMPVSYSTPLFIYPPTVTAEDVAGTMARMHPLVPLLRDVLLNSSDPRAGEWSRERQDALLRSGNTPLHVSYVSFENGLLLNYPGYVPFPEDYDPRRRPWYTEARARYGVNCSRPYPDASGSAILVPCTRSIRDDEGRVIGVAGADASLDNVVQDMRLTLAGWERSTIVDEDGRELIDTGQEGMRLGVGLHGDSPVEAPWVSDALRTRLMEERTGWLHEDGVLVVFDRLEEMDWTFVVRLRASEYPTPYDTF